MKKLWLITYDNLHWCGGELNVVVVADTADEAMYLAGDHMEECQRELFSDEIAEDNLEDEYQANVISVEEFDEKHKCWQYYQDPGQEQFYPTVGKF